MVLVSFKIVFHGKFFLVFETREKTGPRLRDKKKHISGIGAAETSAFQVVGKTKFIVLFF